MSTAPTVRIEAPHNPQVRIFHAETTRFFDRDGTRCFEMVAYSAVHSNKAWEYRLSEVDDDCREIIREIYKALPETHQVYLYAAKVSINFSADYDWSPEKEEQIIEILTRQR